MANNSVLNSDFVRQCLADRGWSQRELADRSGVELRSLQRWLAGQRVDVLQAEKVAVVLERGMASICTELPGGYRRSPLSRLTGLLPWLERRNAVLASGLKLLSTHWLHWMSLIHFHGQPLEEFVWRADVPAERSNTFLPLRIRMPGTSSPATLSFQATVHPRVRFEFGEIWVSEGRTRLREFAFTRELTSTLDAEGRLTVLVWIAPEMRQVVIASDTHFEASTFERPGMDATTFDARDSDLSGALCFRPSAMSLRAAGLPTWDDRYRPLP